MSLADDLASGPPPIDRPASKAPRHPSGWEPSVTQTGTSAEVVSASASDADETQLLLDSDLDPAEWRIVSEVQVRRWQQTPDGEWLRYYKFTASRDPSAVDPGWEDAIKRISRHKPRRPKKANGKTRVFCLSDTQIGKGEGGGSEALAQRVERFIDEATRIVKAEKPAVVYLVGMGDIVEGCDGNYPSQQFTVDLDRRQQERFARRMILAAIEALAPHTSSLRLTCVAGNHGENRRGGKAFTTPGDNADVAVFEAVAEAVALAPAYSHVEFSIPDEELVVLLDIDGTNVAFAHGHQFGGGSNPQQKALNWWKGQAMGRHPAGDADALVTGHYHHLQIVDTHGRLWLQCPSLDGGSRWFTDKTGEWSMPGVLTFRAGPKGLSDIAVIDVVGDADG